MKKLRIFLIAGVVIVFGTGPALSDEFKSVQFVWRAWTGATYKVTPVLESMMPIDFELINRRSDTVGIYYGVPSDVAELEREGDRKSTRLNSSHPSISYAVFCL